MSSRRQISIPLGGRYRQVLLYHAGKWPADVWTIWYWPSLTRGHFTNVFSIEIKIRWKFHSTLIQVVMKWSLRNFARGTIAVLSWHVQLLWLYNTLLSGYTQTNIPSNLNYNDEKIICEIGANLRTRKDIPPHSLPSQVNYGVLLWGL